MNNEIIKFSQSTITALNNAAINKFAAVATAAREAFDYDKKVSVRTFADSLRAVTVGLGMAQAVLAAAIKAVKENEDVEEAMANAALNAAHKARENRDKAKKRADAANAVKALSSVEETLFKLGGRDKSDLLVEIEAQRGVVADLVDSLKSAKEYLAELEARYLVEQSTAFKTA